MRKLVYCTDAETRGSPGRRLRRPRADDDSFDVFGEAIDITLIDKSDTFVFGFSKFDVMFGRRMPADVRHLYSDIVKPGVRFLQSTV